ncbi:MAG TPA: hypothetical protein VFV68_13525 [Agriterribacter sp.]|nr:hypothetical protein [Agriterribacter sp.]
MKSIRLISPFRKGFLAALVISMLSFMASCSSTSHFLNSSVVPAAKGTVKVKKDNNNNYAIKISIQYLTEPGRLQPSKETYVVWMVTENSVTRNMGQINTSTSLFSKRYKAYFETVSAFKPQKIFITAENDGSIQYPGSQVVLTTEDLD